MTKLMTVSDMMADIDHFKVKKDINSLPFLITQISALTIELEKQIKNKNHNKLGRKELDLALDLIELKHELERLEDINEYFHPLN